MSDDFRIVVGAGSLRSADEHAVRFPHRWTTEGVTVEAGFTGAHLLHLAVAGCVLNDLYREATTLSIQLQGVRVTAAGAFDTETWASAGIRHSIDVTSPASADELARLFEAVDQLAEIPRAMRQGAPVERVT